MNDNLLDEIYQYLEGASRYERYIASLCPFHSESRASFFIYPDNYKCSACGAFGKTKSLLDKLRKKHGVFVFRKEEKFFYNPWSHWINDYGNLKAVTEKAHKFCVEQNKYVYLNSRGVDIRTIKALHLGWLDDWITFPIYNIAREVIGATARAGETNQSKAKYVNPANQDPNLLYIPSYELLIEAKYVILTFGILDAVSVYQINCASISTTTGKHVDFEVFDNIRKKIYIAPDAGEEIDACRLSARLGWRGAVLKIDYPDDCKDLNDIACKHGFEQLAKTLEGK